MTLLVVVLLVDGLGMASLPRGSFWRKCSRKIKNVRPTITAPNFVTILTGATPKQHGVVDNHLAAPPAVDCVMHAFDDHVLISDWRQMRHLLPPTVPPEKNFRYRRTWSQLIAEIKLRRRADGGAALLVMNTSTLDTAAHKHGIDSDEARSVIAYIDRRTEKVAALLARSGRQFVLIGVADHGFAGDDHELSHDDDDDDGDDAIESVPLLFVTNRDDIARPKFRSTLRIADFIRSLQKHKP